MCTTSRANRSTRPWSLPSEPLPSPIPPGSGEAITSPLTADGRIFRRDGQPWRWRGVTAFRLLDRFAHGEDIDPFLQAYRGFNLLRVFLWVPVEDWGEAAWGVPQTDRIHAFLDYVGARGWDVELTLLTGGHAAPQVLVDAFVVLFAAHPNLAIELVNEPHVATKAGAKPDTSGLVVPWTSRLWASGDYAFASKMRGTYGVAHTPRDGEWPRKAHDLLEYFTGGGPEQPSDPAHHMPIVGDEPIRPDQAGYVERDFRAYAGIASILGSGATFHSETGKHALPPTTDEARCARAFLQGLTAFPADAPLGSYRKIVEGPTPAEERSLRTYVVGNCMVRVRPKVTEAYESGWTSVDPDGVLWIR